VAAYGFAENLQIGNLEYNFFVHFFKAELPAEISIDKFISIYVPNDMALETK
jgi:hypothetical protein